MTRKDHIKNLIKKYYEVRKRCSMNGRHRIDGVIKALEKELQDLEKKSQQCILRYKS